MLRSGVFRRSLLLLSPTFTELADRLDSFEKEFIELKAFRQAVEATSPKVAEAANEFLRNRSQEVGTFRISSENPLTPEEFTELNQLYAKQKCKEVPFENLLYVNSPNTLLQHAELMYRQYLMRIAKIARFLNNAPYGLTQMSGIQELKKHYQWSFHDVRNNAVPEEMNDLYPFDRVVRRLFVRHHNVSKLLTEGMSDFAMREQWKGVDEEVMHTYEELPHFFEVFCLSRVRFRFLIGNYVYLSTKILNIPKEKYGIEDPDDATVPVFFDHNPDDFVGQICKKCSLLTLAKCVVKGLQAKYDAEIELKLAGDADLRFVGIPYITHDIISAMVEDAVAANTERQELFGKPCTKIEVTVAQAPTSKRFVLRVSDTAGGLTLSQSRMQLSCWSLYKNIEQNENAFFRSWPSSPFRLPYGYCAARVMKGKLTVASIEGYGTDRQLYLPSTGIMGISL
ncbi:putative pyruvate dehydrogenase (lipoamide) kinase [Leptomonas seymouri]|uniref:Protein-serine/threonine kinase n=1 Tax=Leptomonas seymouri TaxID=5684 RepID=A0A0N1PAJ6_LEPSE|nr:putative pyruvate dehydrogenase (lipoamide) kinase [Leptomonas seymouri]|eukprot:KPI84354.1 putative pyruvate dehydrogenase (lipoamide) kinase [Leptomonas seymouri]